MMLGVHLVKAFTQNENQGNPAGVILDADMLSEQQMLSVARHFNFSECVFIQRSNKADFKTRFFTPTQEIDYCGHATIAAFHLLSKKIDCAPKTLKQEANKGIFNINFYENGLITMEQANPTVVSYKINNREISDLLGISAQDIINEPQIISTGTPKLIIPVKSLDALLKMKPNFEDIKRYCQISGARGFYPYTSEVIDSESDFHARQFNPLAGIDEDPVTGVAAGALGSYIGMNNLSDKKTFIVEQGYILNKFGKMYVNIEDKIIVGGHAIQYGTEKLSI